MRVPNTVTVMTTYEYITYFNKRNEPVNIFRFFNGQKKLVATVQAGEKLTQAATVGEVWEASSNSGFQSVDFVPQGGIAITLNPTLATLLSSGVATALNFRNKLIDNADIFWIDVDGQRVKRSTVSPGETNRQATFVNHVWDVVAAGNTTRYLASAIESEINICYPLSIQPNRIYHIVCNGTGTRVRLSDNDSTVSGWAEANNDDDFQKWTLKVGPDGLYGFKNVGSPAWLGTPNGHDLRALLGPVQSEAYDWIIKPESEPNVFRLYHFKALSCMDLFSNFSENDTKLTLWRTESFVNQRWRLEEVHVPL